MPNNQDLHIKRFTDALWLEHSLSENTISAYRSDIEKFRSWIKVNTHGDILECDTISLQEYLSHRLSSGVKASSSARGLSSIKRFYRYLLREGLICEDPTANIDAPRLGRKLPISITESEVEALLAAPDLTTALGIRDRAMMDLMYSSGLRVSELVSLRVHQVHVNGGYIRVFGKGAKERLVPIAEATLDSLRAYLDSARIDLLKGCLGDDVLFPSSRAKEMTRQTFWHRIKAYCSQVGISSALSPHTLRHAFATHLVNNGADLRVVQLLLGHNNLSTTQIYTHVAQERLKSLHTRHHPRG